MWKFALKYPHMLIKTTKNLYRSGTSSSPLLSRIREKDIPFSIIIGNQNEDYTICPIDAKECPGISTWDVPKFTKGHLWMLPEGSLIPSKIIVVNNEEEHWAWSPIETIKYSLYKSQLEEAGKTPPWIKLPKSSIPQQHKLPDVPSNAINPGAASVLRRHIQNLYEQRNNILDEEKLSDIENDIWYAESIIKSWPTYPSKYHSGVYILSDIYPSIDINNKIVSRSYSTLVTNTLHQKIIPSSAVKFILAEYNRLKNIRDETDDEIIVSDCENDMWYIESILKSSIIVH